MAPSNTWLITENCASYYVRLDWPACPHMCSFGITKFLSHKLRKISFSNISQIAVVLRKDIIHSWCILCWNSILFSWLFQAVQVFLQASNNKYTSVLCNVLEIFLELCCVLLCIFRIGRVRFFNSSLPKVLPLCPRLLQLRRCFFVYQWPLLSALALCP